MDAGRRRGWLFEGRAEVGGGVAGAGGGIGDEGEVVFVCGFEEGAGGGGGDGGFEDGGLGFQGWGLGFLVAGGHFAGSGKGGEGGGWGGGGGLERTREAVDGFEVGEGEVFGGGFEVFEATGGGEDAGFVGADGAVVVFDGGAEGAAKFSKVLGEFPEAFVEGAAEGGDFAGVFGEGFLAPAVGDGAEESDEGGGGGEDDALVDAAFDEAGVALEGGGEEGFAGEEEDGELWGLGELGGVVFGGELLDVGADLAGVTDEGFVAGGVFGGFEGVEVAVHRGFGVDDDGFSAGEAYDEVWAEFFAFVGGGGVLDFEVAMFLHAGEFDDAAELHFAPLSAAGGLAEGFDEGGGLALEAELAFAEGADLFLEFGVGTFAGFFDFADAEFEFAEGVGDGFDEGFDGGFALFDFAFGFLGLGGEGGFGEVEELLGGGFQGIGGEGLEGGGEFGFGAFEERLFFGCGEAFAFEAGVDFGDLVAECLGVLLVAVRFIGGLGEARFDFRGAAFFGAEALGDGGQFGCSG